MFIDANLILSFATLLLSLMAILGSIVRKLAKIAFSSPRGST